jgi:hypothetical protein
MAMSSLLALNELRLERLAYVGDDTLSGGSGRAQDHCYRHRRTGRWAV